MTFKAFCNIPLHKRYELIDQCIRCGKWGCLECHFKDNGAGKYCEQCFQEICVCREPGHGAAQLTTLCDWCDEKGCILCVNISVGKHLFHSHCWNTMRGKSGVVYWRSVDGIISLSFLLVGFMLLIAGSLLQFQEGDDGLEIWFMGASVLIGSSFLLYMRFMWSRTQFNKRVSNLLSQI